MIDDKDPTDYDRPEDEENLYSRLNYETAEIPWSELQMVFAQGRVVYVSKSLDLLDVSVQISSDNKGLVESWMATGQVKNVTDDQAKTWLEANTTLWAVVVKPWVLVQE